jgi:hypothetical protein
MGKPFSDLEKQALRLLAGGGNPLTGNDDQLKKYWKWRINPGDPSHNLPTESTRTVGRQLNEIGIIPFGLDLATNQVAKTTVSQRSQTFYASKKSELGHKTLGGTTITIPLDFIPARIYARQSTATAPREETSRITGRKYKTKFTSANQGFSAPFGLKTAGDEIAARQLALAVEIRGLQDVQLVTFTPERFKS